MKLYIVYGLSTYLADSYPHSDLVNKYDTVIVPDYFKLFYEREYGFGNYVSVDI